MKKMNLLLVLVLIFAYELTNAQHYSIKSDASILKWTGKKVTGEHSGTLKLKSGEFNISDNKIISGQFVIDMTSIVCLDIENEEYNKKLVGHLMSDDFFGTTKYPTANFVINKSSKLTNNEYLVKGDLTIKGITHPIEFKINQLKTGDGLKFKGTVLVDRTKYNIQYGSGKFFESLGDNMIYDDFIVELNILAVK